MADPETATELRSVRVWDGSIRLFHWGVVSLLMISVVSVNRGYDRLHVLSGYAMATLLLFRLGWGVFGSESARFGRFVRSPGAAWRHLGRMGTREPDREPGHNAAGGWMVLGLLGVLGLQVTSGFFAREDDHLRGPLSGVVGRAARDAATAIHSANVWLIAAAAAVHLIAITVYLVVKDQDLVGPMLFGDKRLPASVAAPKLARGRLAAVTILVAACAVWALSHLG